MRIGGALSTDEDRSLCWESYTVFCSRPLLPGLAEPKPLNMSFRPLKPASPGRGSDDPQPSRPSRQHPRSRNRDNVVQACDDCRRTKVKVALYLDAHAIFDAADAVFSLQCDGKWPKCSNCVERNRPCGYVGGKGQSRAEAYRSRLDALEKLSMYISEPLFQSCTGSYLLRCSFLGGMSQGSGLWLFPTRKITNSGS